MKGMVNGLLCCPLNPNQLEGTSEPGEGREDHALCWKQEAYVCVYLCVCVCVCVCRSQEVGRVRTRKMRHGEGTALGWSWPQAAGALSAGTLLRAEWGPKGLCPE